MIDEKFVDSVLNFDNLLCELVDIDYYINNQLFSENPTTRIDKELAYKSVAIILALQLYDPKIIKKIVNYYNNKLNKDE